MIVYNDVLGLLAAHGWSQYRLIKEKVFGNETIQRIRRGESVSTDTLDKICALCDCQPGDLLRFVPGDGGGEG